MAFNKLYSFIISPSQKVISEIYVFKKYCNQSVGDFISQDSKAHISVTMQTSESPIVMQRRGKRLTSEFMYIPKVKMTLKNFGHFFNKSSGYTIYAKVETNNYLNLWFRQVRGCFGDRTKFVPHVTIARGLSSDKFLTLWSYFQNHNYESKFNVEVLTLLENGLIKSGPDKTVIQIPFGLDYDSPLLPWNLFDDLL